MINNRFIFLLLMMYMSVLTPSAIAAGGDMAIYTQLVTMTNNMVEQLETLEKATDLQQRLKNMEQAKLVKSLSEAGSALSKTVDNISRAEKIVEDMKSDPFGVEKINEEIKSLEGKIESAENSPGGKQKVQRWARVLRSAKTLSFLGQVNSQNKKAITEGLNDSEAARSTAESSAALVEIMTQEYQQKQASEANEAMVFEGIFKGSRYSNLNDVEDFRYGE